MEIRIMQEEFEQKTLSPFATLSINSKGRKKPEEPCLIRTAFQRDRDRIIHSKAFRRLKHKTQVFIAPEGDHYRTRLTHTLEVSQVARTIARALRLNEDLTEAISLGHDLGHTPFGHSGENALNEIMQAGFHHTEQSLRVVDVLEDGGLNLTMEVRDGILYHSGSKSPSTLEGKVVHLADRIAYINHDIDDAVRAGILQPEDLPPDCIRILGERHAQRINVMVQDVIRMSWRQNFIRMSPKIQKATDDLRGFLFETVYRDSRAKGEESKAKRLLEQLFGHICQNADQFFGPDTMAWYDTVEMMTCDYIAGMTDRYAVAMHQKLFFPSFWQK